MPPATAARLIQAVATEQNADPTERELLNCWVSSGWNVGLSITFGREGAPLFIQGPYDDATRIVRKLNASSALTTSSS